MKQWIRIGSAFLCALLCWEGLTTLLSERRTGRLVDPELGLLGKPGLMIQGREGFAATRINSLYCRGAEVDVNDDSKRRIVALGDSYTEGLQVAEADTFVKTLQRKFEANGRPDIQALNAGRSAKSPPYYIYTGKAWLRHLRSDFAVVQLDERDFTSDFYDKTLEFYAVRDGDSFRFIHRPPKQSVAARYAPYSSIALRLLRAMEERRPVSSHSKPPVAPDPAYVKETRWFMREARKTFPRVAVVYIPAMDYYRPETLAQLTPLEVSLQTAASAEGVPYLNARPLFAQFFADTKQPCHGFNNSVPGFGHINGYGHRLIGEALYQLINPLLKP